MSTALTVALPSGNLRIAHAHDGAYNIRDLCEFASRLNPKRAFLFVSKVLGKHLPARPGAMLATHTVLGNQVAQFIEPGEPTVFIGFAETATGLGAGVFESYYRQTVEPNSLFVQTTRYHLPHTVALNFKEEHSHATGHLVYEPLVGQDIFYRAKTLVLVDDELTTGKTNLNFLKTYLEEVNSGVQDVILVSLVNWMSQEQRTQFANTFPHLSITFCSLFNGKFDYEPTPGFECPAVGSAVGNDEDKGPLIPLDLHRLGATMPVSVNTRRLLKRVPLSKETPVYVIGDGEHMHPAFLLGAELERLGFEAYVQSTTRSPILEGGPIQSMLAFEDHYGDQIANYLYNAPPEGAQVLFVHESTGPLHLLKTLSAVPVHVSELLFDSIVEFRP